MVASYWPQDGGKAAAGSPSDPSEVMVPPAGSAESPRRWPRTARLRKHSEFDQVYSAGRRYGSPLFSAFLLQTGLATSKVGFTVGRGLGRAVRRNRIKRRMRGAVRLHLPEIGPGWNIVFHPRRSVFDVEFSRLEKEVSRLFESVSGKGGRP